jgi:putative Ca2+/H+ antiporter (TMEM165/GDT1 family)
VWQIVALMVNVKALSAAGVGTLAAKALPIHVILRITALYLMIIGIRTVRRIARVDAGRIAF